MTERWTIAAAPMQDGECWYWLEKGGILWTQQHRRGETRIGYAEPGWGGFVQSDRQPLETPLPGTISTTRWVDIATARWFLSKATQLEGSEMQAWLEAWRERVS